jgi:hypothetical protein
VLILLLFLFLLLLHDVIFIAVIVVVVITVIEPSVVRASRCQTQTLQRVERQQLGKVACMRDTEDQQS